jgi:hypothetical protein
MIKWEATDKWGWELSKCGKRDLRISNILEDDIDFEVLYKINLKKPGTFDIVTVWFEKDIIKFSSDFININFTCKSLEEAEKLVEMFCQANSLEIMPAYLK